MQPALQAFRYVSGVVLVATLVTHDPAIVPQEEVLISEPVEIAAELSETSSPAPQVAAAFTAPTLGGTGGRCLKFLSIFKRFDWNVGTALAVCDAESGGISTAIGDRDTQYVSCGLMQIRALPGRPSCEDMQDPEKNIAYAYALWKKQGWKPWSVCGRRVKCE